MSNQKVKVKGWRGTFELLRIEEREDGPNICHLWGGTKFHEKYRAVHEERVRYVKK